MKKKIKKMFIRKLANLPDKELTEIFNQGVKKAKDDLVEKGILPKDSDKKEDD